MIKSLPERKRRTFLRYLNRRSQKSEKHDSTNDQTSADNKEDLLRKIAELKVNSNDDEEGSDFSDDFDIDGESDIEENSDD